MASSVKTLSNHYDTLQVSPTAKNNEIVEAFAAQMRSARLRPEISVTRLAQLSVAYETLRDPVRRRTYDRSLGLNGSSAPAMALRATVSSGEVPLERKFSSANRASPLVSAVKDELHPSAGMEPRLASYIASSLRDQLKKGEPDSASERASRPGEKWRAELRPAPLVIREKESRASRTHRRPSGRVSAIAFTGVAAAGIVGLALALSLPHAHGPAHSRKSSRSRAALTVALPPVHAADERLVAAPRAASDPTTATRALDLRANARERIHAQQATARAPQIQLAEATSGPAPQSQPSDNVPAEVSSQAPVDTPVEGAGNSAPAPVLSRLPLPEVTIARTIERIGYRCGRVLSASGLDESAPGIYKISCSSGDAYRATPVNGRYRFRRWSSR